MQSDARSSSSSKSFDPCRGNGASVLRVVPYAAFHFTAYEKFRGLLARQLYGSETKHHHIPPWLDLLAGSAAGGAAVLLTYPLDLVRTRLAYGSERKGDHHPVSPLPKLFSGMLCSESRLWN